MEILIIGGTRFVGRHIVEALAAAGHRVTLFNRGNNAGLFPELELIRGDRNDPAALAPLAERRWDAVVDTCGYFPGQVERLLAVLERAPHYLFVSTISVYADPDAGPTPLPESAPRFDPDRSSAEVTNEAYGPLKVACEEAAAAHDGPVTVVRPGVVVGPFDPTDRFSYWPARVARGGTMLAPAGDAPLQWVDGRDLAAFAVQLLDDGREGVFNAVTPPDRESLDGLLRACRAAAEAAGLPTADSVRVPWEFLESEGVQSFSDLPMWLPEGARGILRVATDRAEEAGLACRDVGTTAADTLAWLREREAGLVIATGLVEKREAELLERWAAQETTGREG